MVAGIYVHIPFCIRKCKYCDFASFPGSIGEMDVYHRTLIKEIESTESGGRAVDSVFFGGGTPSVYPVELMEDLLCKLRDKFKLNTNECEITMEANPGTLTRDKLLRYKKAGINRISVGLQSADNKELKTLGRIHDFETFKKSYLLAREAGFENINIDLMSGIPGQTVESFTNSLNEVIKLNPAHISVYSLIVEEGTPFFELCGDGGEYEALLPDEDTDREMYHRTKDILGKAGYNRYEISNYSKAGTECRHNLKYWDCEEYFGFGLAAASYIDGERYTNTADMREYIEAEGSPELIRRDKEFIDAGAQMSEYMILGLRKTSGVSISRFKEKFNASIYEVFGEKIEKFIENGLLINQGDRLFLSDYGTDVSNQVFMEFL